MIFATEADFFTEPFMTSLVAIIEIPGIVVALVLASMKSESVNWRTAVHEVLTGRSVLLLVGGIFIGVASSANSFSRVEPFFVGMFAGLLTLFLLDMGASVATRFIESGRPPLRMAIFAIVSPIICWLVGLLHNTIWVCPPLTVKHKNGKLGFGSKIKLANTCACM